MHLRTEVQLGTPRMVEKNMMARVTLGIAPSEDKPVYFEINNVLVMKRKDNGELFVAMPQEPFEITDKDGKKQRRWKSIVRVGPEEPRRGRDEGPTPIQDLFQERVLKAYRLAEETAKTEQTATTTEPATAPAETDEPDF